MSNEAQVPQVPTPPIEVYPDGSPIKKGALSAEFWDTEEKALEIARGRTKGARKACRITAPDKTVRYATTTHPHYLQEYILCHELGYDVSEIGKVAKASAPATATGVLAALNALPEAEREAVKKMIEAQLGVKV